MRTKNYFILALTLLLYSHVNAQVLTPAPGNWCGTHGQSPWLNWYHDHKSELAAYRDLDSTWLYVPVTIHIVTNDQGGGGYPEGNAFRILCEMNEQYTPARIRFYLMPGESFVYHAKSSWFEHDWSGGAEMIETTRIPDRLNCYIVNDPAGNCGYSWYDAIVMGSGCSEAGNSTWAHEAGHHFSLPHPFYGWEDREWNYNTPAPIEWDGYPVEKMDGSNCYESGDRFCDTKPDYLNYRWSCGSDGLSTTQQKDPNGVPFYSDGSLYMGYALDACTSRFTEEQIVAMRTNLYTEHSAYLQETEPGLEIPNNYQVTYITPIDSSIEQYNNVWLQWEPVPNASFYQVEVSNSPNFSILFNNTFVQNATTLNITKNLPNNKVMYWRVRAYSNWDLCNSVLSQPAVFKTKNLSATNDLERVAEIAVNPNPVMAGTPFFLKVNSSERFEILLTLHDASGRLCYQRRTEIYTGDNLLDIPSDQLEAGFYFITMQTTRGTIVNRLVVTE